MGYFKTWKNGPSIFQLGQVLPKDIRRGHGLFNARTYWTNFNLITIFVQHAYPNSVAKRFQHSDQTTLVDVG